MKTREPDGRVCLSPDGICVATTSRERVRSRFIRKRRTFECGELESEQIRTEIRNSKKKKFGYIVSSFCCFLFLLFPSPHLSLELSLNQLAQRVVELLAAEAIEDFFEKAERE